MSKHINIQWDFEEHNDNRLKLIDLEKKLETKGNCISIYNGTRIYTHKGYKWKLWYSKGNNYYNNGRSGDFCDIHIRKIDE